MADPISLLKELIKIPSVSADPNRRQDARKTAEFIENKLKKLGAETAIVENEVEGLNPLLLGKLGNNPDKFTVAIYSHYDVQPALKSDGWATEPFEPIEKDGYIYGRGASDDKGPIAATLTAVEEIVSSGDLPVNFRFIYEGEEESGSGGFEKTLSKHADFLGKIDGIMILDTAWFSDNAPGMDYGFRGLAYMGIEIQGPKKDIHSGLAGGIIREPMTDLVKILAQLHDENHKATIPGFYNDVVPVTPEEEQFYENIDFDIDEFKKANGIPSLLSDDKKTILMDNWRNPCLSIHGIEGAFYEPGAKTVIPGKVIGKVSMRLVPNQDPSKIAKLFTEYVEQLFKELKSPNKLKVYTYGTGDWWYGDPNSFLYSKARKILKEYWGIEPTLTRSGGSIPIIPFMEKLFDAPAIAIGIGQNSDGAHSQNERVRIKNIVGAKEVLKLYFSELSKS
ncbi:MAG: M20/M25/M40 family metallo-hydrolase [Methanobacteriota archaeon]|nr:MAG: M20/M25/M40 family metallo-hydrolase [Euryarchaeota archaeon]